MITNEQLIHDLTISLLSKTCNETIPETYVEKYFELSLEVKEAVDTYTKQKNKKNKIKAVDRSKLGL